MRPPLQQLVRRLFFGGVKECIKAVKEVDFTR